MHHERPVKAALSGIVSEMPSLCTHSMHDYICLILKKYTPLQYIGSRLLFTSVVQGLLQVSHRRLPVWRLTLVSCTGDISEIYPGAVSCLLGIG